MSGTDYGSLSRIALIIIEGKDSCQKKKAALKWNLELKKKIFKVQLNIPVSQVAHYYHNNCRNSQILFISLQTF